MKQNIQKKNTLKTVTAKPRMWVSALFYTGVTILGCAFFILCFFVLEGKHAMQENVPVSGSSENGTNVANEPLSFPVSVKPDEEIIIENPKVEIFFHENISREDDPESAKTSWVRRAVGKLALMGWYQNLASLSSRILVIDSGERKEQVGEHFAKILKWSKEDEARFLTLIESEAPSLIDGKFYPGTYTVSRGATPEEVAPLILDRFNAEVLSRYTSEVEEQVPLDDALTIASLLEREAYDFEDMRHISGVIWNRLFSDMRLQIDATLQYAKGSRPSEPWWPRVVPNDKYITSEYNTYKNDGLPPTPIANPGLASILAALNPTKTDCMYYFHDKKAGFHCSKTYEEHVNLLKQYYGQGK